ncbi:MAG: RagB/SusD family nutrient uptake outer membrane protein [Bacteroidales bacterium]|nr:RagB/SusD family nutrient uptake outer membrane protein [Bacteroidales bacterium]
MKTIVKTIAIAASALILGACSFLEPLPNGAYTDENFDLYPELLRGFVDKVYRDYFPTNYNTAYYVGISSISSEAVYTNPKTAKRMYSEGTSDMTYNPFADLWNDSYASINYLNMFLKDNVGYNTQYMLNQEADRALRKCLQGDAYGLRAWNHFLLLRMFAGEGTDGKMYGIPLMMNPTEYENIDNSSITRATIDECCEAILRDCDSACVYLPESNRDYPDDPQQTVIVTGSARYTRLDQVAVKALKATLYLYWASPYWNPTLSQNDPVIIERYSKAAEYAAEVMRFKLEVESALTGGFDPLKKMEYHNPNSSEIIWCSKIASEGQGLEKSFYPIGFGGSADIVPSQAVIDQFPAANGYPIGDPRSKYDQNNPYQNRDPRFYTSVNFDGAKVIRNTDPTDIMYTFNTREGGPDAPGLVETSTTGYYIKKFVYTGWNPFDADIQTSYHPLMLFRWTEMCLVFAEAASKVGNPTTQLHGYSAKQALAWLRSRPTMDGTPGVGSTSDPYLDECAGDPQKFEELVKSEWRVETCFEGHDFYNSRRWATDVSEINVPIKRVLITGEGDATTYNYETVTTLNYPSLWQPIPYLEVRRCPNLVQNKGFESWK